MSTNWGAWGKLNIDLALPHSIQIKYRGLQVVWQNWFWISLGCPLFCLRGFALGDSVCVFDAVWGKARSMPYRWTLWLVSSWDQSTSPSKGSWPCKVSHTYLPSAWSPSTSFPDRETERNAWSHWESDKLEGRSICQVSSFRSGKPGTGIIYLVYVSHVTHSYLPLGPHLWLRGLEVCWRHFLFKSPCSGHCPTGVKGDHQLWEDGDQQYALENCSVCHHNLAPLCTGKQAAAASSVFGPLA